MEIEACEIPTTTTAASTAMDDDEDDSIPPLMATYKHLLDSSSPGLRLDADVDKEYCGDLPVIDLAGLLQGGDAAAEAAIVGAASEWGFFTVTNHGVPEALLDAVLRAARARVFRRPFARKAAAPLPGFAPESYRWGTPTARSLDQLSWSEAYHIPMWPSGAAATGVEDEDDDDDDRATRQVIEDVATAMSQLAQRLARVLVAGMQQGDDTAVAEDEDDDEVMTRCTRDTCFLRLNRYPPCPPRTDGIGVFGLCPHTDSDFLTVLHQDGAGGLQLRRDDGRWVAVRPDPGALVVNVGDLLQARSNERYRSVEHRVVASATRERFSVAFFLCPADDVAIRPRGGGGEAPPRYKTFTFGEYRDQVREDVRLTGRKLGLQRFRLSSS